MKTTNLIEVNPTLTYATESISQLPLSVRHCSLPYERRLASYEQYNYHNCIVECKMNMTIKHCGCIPFRYAHLKGQSLNKIPILYHYIIIDNFSRTAIVKWLVLLSNIVLKIKGKYIATYSALKNDQKCYNSITKGIKIEKIFFFNHTVQYKNFNQNQKLIKTVFLVFKYIIFKKSQIF